MTLTLRLENFDVMEHGGPPYITLDRNGCDVGRNNAMHWVLPDPARHISSHHFSVAFRDGAYWLTDVSTNGVFLQGQRHRIEGAHKIAPNDRFIVGHYIILAEMSAPAPGRAPQGTASTGMLQMPPFGGRGAAVPIEADPWDFGGPAAPVDPSPRRSGASRLNDAAQDFVPAAVPMPNPGAVSRPPAGFQPSPFQPAPMQPTPAVGGSVQGNAILAAFCEGAGLDPADYPNIDPVVLARELGSAVRVASSEIITILQDRAAVKQFTRGGERTMRSATGNNPMKFLPEAAQAIETMFLKHRDGFMKGPDGFASALRDIRSHQSAVFAALQPALASVLSGISPDEIEDSAGSGILGGASKGKFWDAYVARWDSKANSGDNGMLDAFLAAFAKAYTAAAGKAID